MAPPFPRSIQSQPTEMANYPDQQVSRKSELEKHMLDPNGLRKIAPRQLFSQGRSELDQMRRNSANSDLCDGCGKVSCVKMILL